MGEMMSLLQVVRELAALDRDSTIYAAKPWALNSKAVVRRESDKGQPFCGGDYFLEVFIAQDLLRDWEKGLSKQITDEQRCARLIQYAIADA
jgi:hypothetical protein